MGKEEDWKEEGEKGKRRIRKMTLVLFNLPVSWAVVLHADANSGLPCTEPVLEPAGVTPGHWWQVPHHVEL